MFKPSEMVRIKNGPFQAFTGRVEEVNEAEQLLKVLVTIFGRSTPIGLKFADVEKLQFGDESGPQPPWTSNN